LNKEKGVECRVKLMEGEERARRGVESAVVLSDELRAAGVVWVENSKVQELDVEKHGILIILKISFKISVTKCRLVVATKLSGTFTEVMAR